MHSIENDFLKVSAHNFGAELKSIFNKKNGIEHLWQADEKWWGWHAPLLFPVVGRCLNDKIKVGDKFYAMEKHGFARKSNFRLVEKNDASMVFSLNSTEETLALFPFEFELTIRYELQQNALLQTFVVLNKSSQNMLFSLGAHPAFAVPFSANESFNDYYIQFENEEKLIRNHISADGYFDGRETVVSTNGKIDLFPSLFNDDALIFKDHSSRSVSIKSLINQHELSVSFDGFPYLGIWTKPGAPYVCIEPWFGCADTAGKETDFAEKEGVLVLEPEANFQAVLKIVAR